MKLIIEEKQFERITAKIAESATNRSLLASRKAGISAIFPKGAFESNPLRFRPAELERKGIEEADAEENFYVEDNSDPQL